MFQAINTQLSYCPPTRSLIGGNTLPPQQTVGKLGGKNIQVINLDDPNLCVSKYGFPPGAILKSRKSLDINSLYEVVGLGKKDGRLWLSHIYASQEAFQLAHVHNKKDLETSGYYLESLNKRKHPEIINDSQEVIKRFRKIFKDQIGCDVFFQFGKNQIGGHSAILKESSDYFRALLAGNFKEGMSEKSGQARVISINDLDECNPKIFEELLEYLYCGSITINEENIIEVAFLADRFGITQLIEHCKLCMSEILINSDYPLTFFQKTFGTNHWLRSLIENYLNENWFTALRIEDCNLESLTQEEVLYLLNYFLEESLNESRKIILFEIAVVWLKNEKFESDPSEGVAFLKKIWPLFPKHVPAFKTYTQLWKLHMEVNTTGGFEKIALASGNDAILLIHANCLRKNDCLDEAKALLENVLNLFPTNSAILSIYAKVLLQLGHLELAKSNIEEALQLDSKNDLALKYCAQISAQLYQSD